MTPEQIAGILTAAAWPATTLALVLAFRKGIAGVLHKLEDTLSLKSIKVKLFGAEIELTPDQADRALNEMMQEVAESTRGLSESDLKLLRRIREVRGALTVGELIPGFTRDSEELTQLRRLRDMKFIRPNEGGKWEPAKHPIVTRFAEIFMRLMDQSHHTHPD